AFISVGAPGLWTHWSPTVFSEAEALELSAAGADCLHVHKSTVSDYEVIAELSHKYGMLVEGYISDPNPDTVDLFEDGVPATTSPDVAARTRDLESAGVDLI